ncbi:unnamed protein product [Aphanomyces euteiches]
MSLVQGIEIVERVPIPKELVPQDAQVEISAKVYAGYNGGNVFEKLDKDALKEIKGRGNEDYEEDDAAME